MHVQYIQYHTFVLRELRASKATWFLPGTYLKMYVPVCMPYTAQIKSRQSCGHFDVELKSHDMCKAT
jgi:hypothetical protein